MIKEINIYPLTSVLNSIRDTVNELVRAHNAAELSATTTSDKTVSNTHYSKVLWQELLSNSLEPFEEITGVITISYERLNAALKKTMPHCNDYFRQ